MREIVLAQRLVMEMRPNKPEAAQGMGSDPEFSQRFERGGAACSDQYLFHCAAA